jgi:acylphosphatase
MIVRLRVDGRVQGVWYRGWLVEEAAAQSVDGWVRNRADGTVEAVLAGNAATIQALIQRCHEGPKHARVTSIDVLPATDRPSPGFLQLPTL